MPMKDILLKILKISAKALATVLLVLVFILCISSLSPVYRFPEARPFSGPDIFNPYSRLDSAYCWKRANFHTHTRVDGIFNECEYSPMETYGALAAFGYDIVTFSNHNELTVHPFDPALQVNVYEHGYNLFKYHKLVFGSDKVNRFDNMLPLFAFQKQFQLDLLNRDCDFIQMNHPYRTGGTSPRQMERLTGYRIMELDSGISTEQEYWDWALSAGHYSFGLANDDLHYPDRSGKIAVRCNFLCCPSASYEDIKQCLLGGCYYSMRVPDYGNGDWETKYAKNRELPRVEDIGLKHDTVYLRLSEVADSIKVTGSGHSTLAMALGSKDLEYKMGKDEPYARMTAYFPEGEVIYTNPFARYDASRADSPYCEAGHPVDIPLTLLFNLLVLVLSAAVVFLICKVVKK